MRRGHRRRDRRPVGVPACSRRSRDRRRARTTRGFEWLKWLPHTRSPASPLRGPHVTSTPAAANALVNALLEVAGSRHQTADAHRRCWPQILLVGDDSVGVDPAALARLLEVAPDVGISVVWLAASPAGIPRQADRVLRVGHATGAASTARLWSTDPDIDDAVFELEILPQRGAERIARALSPVCDVQAGVAGGDCRRGRPGRAARGTVVCRHRPPLAAGRPAPTSCA